LKQRGLFLLGYEAVGIIGFIILASSKAPHVQYTGAFFAAAGKSCICFVLDFGLIVLQELIPTSR
jgi:hypothetical protein